MSVCPTTWLNMALVDLTCDFANTVHGRNGIEMDARYAETDQLAALFHRPLYPHLFGFFVRFTFSYFQSQSLGQVAMERFRYYGLIPGMMGMVMPARRARSTKSKYFALS